MNPAVILLTLFIGVPLVEIYFLIEVGSSIGAFPTILLTVATAVLGATLVQRQGFTTAMRARESVDRGEVPAIEMLEGLALLISGIFLLLPGFVTDALGFLCLIPPIRQAVILGLLRRSGTLQPGATGNPTQPGGEHKVIEGDYERHDDDQRQG